MDVWPWFVPLAVFANFLEPLSKYYEFDYFNTTACNSLSSTTRTTINHKIVM